MQVIDYTNNDINNVQFNGETIVIMAHQRKILMFNDHEELWKIKYILEEICDELDYDNDDFDLIDGALRYLVDPFEEESYFLENKNVSPRNLIIKNNSNDNDDSKIAFYFGYLNSSDTFLDPNEYKIIAEHLIDFANNSGCCKEVTKELVLNFSNELLLEYKAYEEQQPFFKIIVIEG